MSDADEPRLALVTGAPRSGTTFVGDWISQADDAYCAHEILPLLEGADDAEILRVLRRCALTGEDRLGKPLQREFLRWGPHDRTESPALLGLKEPIRWPVAGAGQPYPVGGFLSGRGARYVFLVRHPLDAVASGRRRGTLTRNWPGYGLDEHLAFWADALRWHDALVAAGEAVLLLRFEDLLLDPDDARDRLRRHLGVELQPFDGFERTPEELAALRAGTTRAAGYRDGEARALVSAAERAQVAAAVGASCARLGYET